MMNKLYTFLLLILFTQTINAQQVVNYEKVASLSILELSAIFPLQFITPVDAYRVEYKSLDVHGALDTLSGLVVFPSDSINIYPKAAYMHGTVASREQVPSNVGDEADLIYLIAGLGYAVVAPDYPGLGIGRGFHPYVHARSEGQSGVDLVRAMEEIAVSEQRLLNDQLFITGYSQGGHAAMGMHKLIEEEYSTEYTVTASSPMSGPYSLSGVMLDFVLDGNEYNFAAYLPNTVLSMQTAYGNIYTDLEEVFKSIYVDKIEEYYNEEIDLLELNAFLLQTLIANEGAPIALKLFQEDYIADLMSNPDHPLLVAFQDNDLFNWVPTAPTKMMYCLGDDQVPYLNSVVADSTMNALGAADVEAIQVGGEDMDHGDCLVPAILATRSFFGSFQEILSSTNNPNLTAIHIYPNPAFDFIEFDLPTALNIVQVRMINILGAVENIYELNGNTLNISDLSKGMKVLEFIDNKGSVIGVEKLVVN